MTDYAGNGPTATFDYSDSRVVPLRPGAFEPRPQVFDPPAAGPETEREDDAVAVPDIESGTGAEAVRREALPAEPSGAPTLEQRLETFIGLNCDDWLHYYRQTFSAGARNPLRHWHWVPFAFSTVWLFARRRYALATVLGLLPMGAHWLFPGGLAMATAFILVAIGCGFAGRPLYLVIALKRVADIDAQRLWPVQRDHKLHRSGGVSVTGAACGLAIWAAAAALPFVLG